LRADLDATDFRDLSCPVNNCRRADSNRAEAREGLQQVPNPVRVRIHSYLAGQGIGRSSRWEPAYLPGCCRYRRFPGWPEVVSAGTRRARSFGMAGSKIAVTEHR